MANSDLATTTEQSKTTPAAYLPFKTFISALESLEHGIPKRLDRSIWRSQSGITQSQIMMALRFFCLIDDNDQPTPALARLVDGKDKRSEHIGALLRHCYKAIIDRDLTKTTPKMLNEMFDDYNVAGDTKRKAIAFFLRAAQFAEVPLHPLLTATMRNSSGPRKKKSAPVKQRGHIERMNGAIDPVHNPPATSGSVKTVRLSSGGSVTLRINADPFTLPEADRKFVFGLIDDMKVYADKFPSTEELVDAEDGDDES